MKRNFTFTVFSCLAFMALVLGLFVNRMTTTKELRLEDFKDLGAYLILPTRKLQDFELVNSDGDEFSPKDFVGKWNMLFFGFTFCPDICPITMSMLADVEKDLDQLISENINIFMVSVDPNRDTPEKLDLYLKNFSQDFIGLTGKLDQIYKFSTQVNAPFMPIADTSDPYYTVDHTSSIVLINPLGDYAGFFRAPHNKENISLALKALVKQYK